MIESLEKTPMKPVLYAFEYSALRPTAITFPALQTRKVRDVAQLTSTAKELCAYTVKCVDAMRRAWVGAGEARGKGMGKTGAGERDGVSGMGGRWVESMRGVLRKHGGTSTSASHSSHSTNLNVDADPNPVLELTILLLTGRPSEGLHDFLGSAESVTERVRGADFVYRFQSLGIYVSFRCDSIRSFFPRSFCPTCPLLVPPSLSLYLLSFSFSSYLPSFPSSLPSSHSLAPTHPNIYLPGHSQMGNHRHRVPRPNPGYSGEAARACVSEVAFGVGGDEWVGADVSCSIVCQPCPVLPRLASLSVFIKTIRFYYTIWFYQDYTFLPEPHVSINTIRL